MYPEHPNGFMKWVRAVGHTRVAKIGIKTTRRTTAAALSLARRSSWLRRRFNLPLNDVVHPLQAETSAGIRTLCTAQPHSFRRSLPLLPEDPAALPFYEARVREPSDPSYVAVLDQGYIWGYAHGGVFTRDGHFVADFARDPWGPSLHAVWMRPRLPKPKRIAGRMLYLVTPEAARNYHHWMIDLLPRIGQIERAGLSIDHFDHVVVNHTNKPFQWQTLEALGVPRDKVLAIDEATCLQPDQLVVPSLKYSNEVAPGQDIRFLRDTFLDPTNTPSARRRIFLSRRDAQVRCLKNEAEIEQLLHAYGFVTIAPSTLSVHEQARVFSEAEMIVGSGAGLANLVFARPGTHVIELASPRWLTVYHWMISARLALKHTILLADGLAPRTDMPRIEDREIDFSLNPDKLRRVLLRLPEHPTLRTPHPPRVRPQVITATVKTAVPLSLDV